MLEDVLGRDVFFQGLQHYLHKFKFSNAETNDLWQCLTEQVQNGQVNLSKVTVIYLHVLSLLLLCYRSSLCLIYLFCLLKCTLTLTAWGEWT